MKVATVQPAGYPSRVIAEKAIKIIEERAKGRFKIDYYPGGALLKAKEGFDGAKRGTVQVAEDTVSTAGDRLGVVALYDKFPRNYALVKFIQRYREPGGVFDLLSREVEKNGLKLAAHAATGMSNYYFTKKVTTFDDMKGKIVKSQGAEQQGMAKMLGMTPTDIASSETYEALQRGVLDGALMSLAGYTSNKWDELAPWVVRCSAVMSSQSLFMNLEWFNALPKDLQGIVNDAFKEASAEVLPTVPQEEDKIVVALKARPKMNIWQFSEADNAEFDKRIAPMYAEWEKKYGDQWKQLVELSKPLK